MKMIIDIPDDVYKRMKDNKDYDYGELTYAIDNGSIADTEPPIKELEDLSYQNGRQEGYALGFTRGFKAGWSEAKEEYSNVK